MINPAKNSITLINGTEINYDILIIATGTRISPEETPGLKGELWQKNIFDFYLLYWAWGDLDYGSEYQSYWPDAVKENIESIVISTADKWVKENKKHCEQTI